MQSVIDTVRRSALHTHAEPTPTGMHCVDGDADTWPTSRNDGRRSAPPVHTLTPLTRPPRASARQVRDEKERLEKLEEEIMSTTGPEDARLESIY